MSNERIDIELMESRIRLWREGDISDEDLALEMDYMVPELKRCYEMIDLAVAVLKELHQVTESNELLMVANYLADGRLWTSA